MDVWMPLYARAPLYFAPRDALRKGGGLVDTLREISREFFQIFYYWIYNVSIRVRCAPPFFSAYPGSTTR